MFHQETLTLLAASLLAALLLVAWGCPAWGSDSSTTARGGRTAILLAHFGTTVPSGVSALARINRTVRAAYPGVEVRTTFTSNIIRGVWKKRRPEMQAWLDQGVPEEFFRQKNLIATVGDLLEDGYSTIVVQPTHMFYMEQSHDLQQYVNALGSIRTMKERWRPFEQIVMGRPALGMPGERYPYPADIEEVVATLAADVAQARQSGAMLLYMGHGNAHWSSGVYAETAATIRRLYPEVAAFVGVVEGYPSLAEILPQLHADGRKKVLLKPFMIVAGDHAVNDMVGEGEDSWRSLLRAEGFAVEAVISGLGDNDQFAEIFVRRIADAARDRGISLK